MPLLHDVLQTLTARSFRRRLILPASILLIVFLLSHGLISQLHSALNNNDGALANTVPRWRAPIYKPGTPKRAGESYTRTLVIARTVNESITWLTDDHELAHASDLKLAIYTVDDPQSNPRVPANKGHEVMPYLTHIITNYDNLTDITAFMHAHRWTWHNNDLLDSDAKSMLMSLSSPKVVRDGYVNLRCHLNPGCPDHIHPGNPSTAEMDQLNHPEEAIIGQAWLELFPDENGPPRVLSQPCCGQFALSAERIRTIPLARYVFFRDWLLKTTLEDRLSGRVWEYVWQYVFAGVHEFCPEEHVCYCDSYGVCFGGKAEFESWFSARKNWRMMSKEREECGEDETEKKKKITSQMDAIQTELETMKASALERGETQGAELQRLEEIGRKEMAFEWCGRLPPVKVPSCPV